MKELFKNRNFSILFAGRMITNAGDSLYIVATMWLVYELGGSTFYTGIAGFLVMFPNMLQFLAGPLVDRWSLKSTLLITQILQAIFVLIIPIASYFNFLSVTLVLIIMPIVAMLNQFVYPAQTAALPKILEKKHLVKGNSAFAFAYQGIDLAFNAIAGVLVALIGATALFLIDSVTFVIAALLFSTLRIPEKEKVPVLEERTSISDNLKKYGIELKEGFTFVIKSVLAKLFVGSIVANFAIGATLAVLPAYADWRGGPEYYGLFLASLSAGSLIGALCASYLSKYPLGRLSIISFFIGGISWVVSALVPWASLSVLLFGLAWVPVGATNVLFGTAVQTIVPQRLMARTISVSASIGTSAMPIGSLLGGWSASSVSSMVVFAVLGTGFIFLAIYTSSVPVLRNLPKVKEMNTSNLELNDTFAAKKKMGLR